MTIRTAPADFGPAHAVSPNQFRDSAESQEIDLGVTVTENMDVGRLVIVEEDNHAQAEGTKHGNHDAYNLSSWVIQYLFAGRGGTMTNNSNGAPIGLSNR